MKTDWNFVIDQLAEDIVYELEGDVLNRKGLSDEFQSLDNDIVHEIRDLWKEIIIEKLKNVIFSQTLPIEDQNE